jgi:glycosyltransferase involved in cell wall biosynthesis
MDGLVQQLRVGIFTECYRPIQNGVVESIDSLRAALRARGHDAICVTPRMPRYDDADDGIVRLASLPLPSAAGYRLTLPYVSPSARRALRGVSIVHAHSPFVTGNVALRAARSRRIPLVFTYHTRLEFYAHYAPFDVQITRAAVQAWTRAFADAADAVIAPTQSTASALRAIGVRSRIEVIPSGIDLRPYALARRAEGVRRRLGAGDGDVLVLWVGRVAREKNLELALAVAAVLPPRFRLSVVGGGPERGRYEAAAAALGLSGRVTFAGEVDHASLPGIYASADVLLFTSSSETQGLVLVEALAAGLPIAAVDVPATREVAAGSAVLAPPEASALAAAAAAAAADTRTRAERSAGADRFDRDALGGQVVALYRSLLGS